MTKPVDWWTLVHKAMTELSWEPAQLARLTIPQLICLGTERDPTRKTNRTESDLRDLAARRSSEEERWRGS